MKKVSLQMIADAVGVSRATVSLVLSGKAGNKRVSDEMSARIVSKAKELNYRPNELARGLRTGKTRTFGIIVADISNEFFAKYIYEIQTRARKYDYAVITTNMDENREQFGEMASLLVNRSVDGIIAVPVDGCEESISELIDSHIPLVLVDRRLDGVAASSVTLDNYGAAFKSVECLVMQGCRKIAIVRHNNSSSVSLDRTQGCLDALARHGLPNDDSVVRLIDYSVEEDDLRRAMQEISSTKDGFDGVFFMSHELFITGVRYLYKNQVRIPQDIKVACFDKMEIFSILNFPLIYVDQPIKAMAERAVDLLMAQIHGNADVQNCVFEGDVCFC